MFISDDGMKLITEQLPYKDQNDFCKPIFWTTHKYRSSAQNADYSFNFENLPSDLKNIVGIFLSCYDMLSLISACKENLKKKTSAYFLFKLKNVTTLTTEDYLHYSRLCDISTSDVFFKYCPQLTHLIADGELYFKGGGLKGRIKVPMEQIIEALKICPKLQYLSLSSYFNVYKIFEHCSNIKGLHLSETYSFPQHCLYKLAEGCPKLKYLHLNGGVDSKSSFLYMVKKLNHLSFLGIYISHDDPIQTQTLNHQEITEITSSKVFIKVFPQPFTRRALEKEVRGC